MTQEKHSQAVAAEQAQQSFTGRNTRLRFLWYIVLLWSTVIVFHRYASRHSMPSAEGRHNDLSAYTETIFVPFAKAFTSDEIPLIWTTVEGVSIKMPVDTGSTGLLIGAPVLPNVDPVKGIPGRQFFTSSRILYIGRYINLNITFRGAGTSRAVAQVPVLIVDKSFFCPWYDPSNGSLECPQGPKGEEPEIRDTSNITYMGVGFGRNKLGAGPAMNPFLNVVTIDDVAITPGSLRPGYAISTEGIHIGLTKANTEGFSFTKLERGQMHGHDNRDWDMLKMCFKINGRGSNCGPALIDTGVSQMYIRSREGVSIPSVIIPNPNPNGRAKEVERVKPGTEIAVGFPCLCEHSVAGYSFVVGGQSAMEPKYAIPGRKTPGPFVNTGRNFFFGYSTAFDAEGGRYGFRAVDRQETGEASRAPRL